MLEQKIEIKTNGQYKNIKPKQDLDVDNYIVVEKIFLEGKQVKSKFDTPAFAVSVLYEGEQVGFFLNERENTEFAITGGVGDKIKVIKYENVVVNPRNKAKSIFNNVRFEKHEN